MSNPCDEREEDVSGNGLNSDSDDASPAGPQNNSEVAEASSADSGDELGFENYQSSARRSRTVAIPNFIVPTYQLNLVNSSAFREKVTINQELFFPGQELNALPYDAYSDNSQEYRAYSSFDADAELMLPRREHKLGLFTMMPPNAIYPLHGSDYITKRADIFRFVSAKWWTHYNDDEVFRKIEGVPDDFGFRLNIAADGSITLPPKVINNRYFNASTLCAHTINFRKSTIFNTTNNTTIDQFILQLDENNATVANLISKMVDEFSGRIPGLTLEDAGGNISINTSLCMSIINSVYFFGSFSQHNVVLDNQDLLLFIQNMLGVTSTPIFPFGPNGTTGYFEDIVHTIEMPFTPKETNNLIYPQYTSVNVEYITARSGTEEDISNLPSIRANNLSSARQKNIYRTYYNILTNNENRNAQEVSNPIGTVPSELNNLYDSDGQQLQDTEFLPNEDWRVNSIFLNEAGRAGFGGHISEEAINDMTSREELEESLDCESLDDDRLLLFTTDNVKEMQSINNQMKSLYDYYVKINITTQQGTAIANMLDETEMDKYLLLSYFRPLTTLAELGNPNFEQNDQLWWHEKYVTEVLDSPGADRLNQEGELTGQLVAYGTGDLPAPSSGLPEDAFYTPEAVDAQQRLTDLNNRFQEQVVRKFIKIDRHITDLTINHMIGDLGNKLKYFPLRFKGSNDLVTNAFFDMINRAVFQKRYKDFITPAGALDVSGEHEQGDIANQGGELDDFIDLSGNLQHKGKIRSYREIMLGKKAYSETIGYKIEKYDYNPEGELNAEPLQAFILCDSDEVKEIELLDNQVIYGKDYCYKIFALNLVLGNKYIYSPTELSATDPDTKQLRAEQAVVINAVSAPVLYLTETPYFTKTISTFDKPPVFPSVSFIPLKGVDNRVGIDLSENTGVYRLEPISIIEEDEERIKSQLLAAENSSDGKITYKDDSPLTNFEIFRLDRPPLNYQDFSNGSYREYYPRHSGMIDSVIRPIPDQDLPTILPGRGQMFFDNISPNTDYYYTFRSVDHAGISVPTEVFKVRLVSYENGMYLDVDTYEFPKEKQKSIFFQRVLQIAPSLEQKIFNIPSEQNLKTAYETVPENTVELGIKSKKVWDKTYKFRITSCNTNRKVDLNVKFKQKNMVEKEPTSIVEPCEELDYTPAGDITGRIQACPPGSIRNFDTGLCEEIERPPPPPREEKDPVPPPPPEPVIEEKTEEIIEEEPLEEIFIFDPCPEARSARLGYAVYMGAFQAGTGTALDKYYGFFGDPAERVNDGQPQRAIDPESLQFGREGALFLEAIEDYSGFTYEQIFNNASETETQMDDRFVADGGLLAFETPSSYMQSTDSDIGIYASQHRNNFGQFDRGEDGEGPRQRSRFDRRVDPEVAPRLSVRGNFTPASYYFTRGTFELPHDSDFDGTLDSTTTRFADERSPVYAGIFKVYVEDLQIFEDNYYNLMTQELNQVETSGRLSARQRIQLYGQIFGRSAFLRAMYYAIWVKKNGKDLLTGIGSDEPRVSVDAYSTLLSKLCPGVDLSPSIPKVQDPIVETHRFPLVDPCTNTPQTVSPLITSVISMIPSGAGEIVINNTMNGVSPGFDIDPVVLAHRLFVALTRTRRSTQILGVTSEEFADLERRNFVNRVGSPFPLPDPSTRAHIRLLNEIMDHFNIPDGREIFTERITRLPEEYTQIVNPETGENYTFCQPPEVDKASSGGLSTPPLGDDPRVTGEDDGGTPPPALFVITGDGGLGNGATGDDDPGPGIFGILGDPDFLNIIAGPDAARAELNRQSQSDIGNLMLNEFKRVAQRQYWEWYEPHDDYFHSQTYLGGPHAQTPEANTTHPVALMPHWFRVQLVRTKLGGNLTLDEEWSSNNPDIFGTGNSPYRVTQQIRPGTLGDKLVWQFLKWTIIKRLEVYEQSSAVQSEEFSATRTTSGHFADGNHPANRTRFLTALRELPSLGRNISEFNNLFGTHRPAGMVSNKPWTLIPDYLVMGDASGLVDADARTPDTICAQLGGCNDFFQPRSTMGLVMSGLNNDQLMPFGNFISRDDAPSARNRPHSANRQLGRVLYRVQDGLRRWTGNLGPNTFIFQMSPHINQLYLQRGVDPGTELMRSTLPPAVPGMAGPRIGTEDAYFSSNGKSRRWTDVAYKYYWSYKFFTPLTANNSPYVTSAAFVNNAKNLGTESFFPRNTQGGFGAVN